MQFGLVALTELSPAIWLTLLFFPTGQIISIRGVLTAVEYVVYVMWYYIIFGTAVINIVTIPTQVRV